MTTDHIPEDLTITDNVLLGIAETLARDFEHFDLQDLGKVAVRAQIGTGLAAVYQAIELGRLVKSVDNATRALEKLNQATVDPKLLESLDSIRKVISSNG